MRRLRVSDELRLTEGDAELSLAGGRRENSLVAKAPLDSRDDLGALNTVTLESARATFS